MQVLDNATINLEKELFEMKHEAVKVQVQDKDVSEKRAGGIYGQFLFEKGEEIKKNSPADNKITDQENWREKTGEKWKSPPQMRSRRWTLCDFSVFMHSQHDDAIGIWTWNFTCKKNL